MNTIINSIFKVVKHYAITIGDRMLDVISLITTIGIYLTNFLYKIYSSLSKKTQTSVSLRKFKTVLEIREIRDINNILNIFSFLSDENVMCLMNATEDLFNAGKKYFQTNT